MNSRVDENYVLFTQSNERSDMTRHNGFKLPRGTSGKIIRAVRKYDEQLRKRSVWSEVSLLFSAREYPDESFEDESAEQSYVELLLSRGVEEINFYLLEMALQVARQQTGLEKIRRLGLYLAPSGVPTEKFICFIGRNLLEPDVYIPTVDQLHESCEWHQKRNTVESSFCENVDTWTRFHVELSLKKIFAYRTIMAGSLQRWEDAYENNGEPLKLELVKQYRRLCSGLQTEMKGLKELRAPEHMQRNCADRLTEMKVVIGKLEKIAHN